jgi:hypothetical protein
LQTLFSRALVAAMFVAACAHTHAEFRPDEGRHPCDPSGPEVARYVEPADLDAWLLPDELALRGKCWKQPTSSPDFSVQDRVRNLSRALEAGFDCSGACRPMRAALPRLDESHDLEDETLQRECAAAAGKLGAAIRVGCQHVCLVERRKLAARAIFARVMAGLYAFARKPFGSGPDEFDGAVRNRWTAAKLPLPPRRFHLRVRTNQDTMSAEGTLYPGGPTLRLELTKTDTGCGASDWTVLPW